MKKIIFILLLLLAFGISTPASGDKGHNEYWDSPEELQEFLDATQIHRFIKMTGDTLDLSGLCFYTAEAMSRNAEDIGKRLEIIPISRIEYYNVFGEWAIDKNTRHYMNGAVMKNGDYYYVEPAIRKIKWVSYVPNNRPELWSRRGNNES